MKKVVFGISLFIFCMFPSQVNANENINSEKFVSIEVEELGDGYTIETIIEEEVTMSTRAANTKTGKKTVYYKNGSTTLWTVSVHGTFTYTGSTSKCTGSSVSAQSYDSNWKITDKQSTKSGITAFANATGKRYTLGIAVQTISREVKLSCSKDGKLS